MYFGGLDAHLTYLTIAVVDRAGEVLLQERMATTEPSRLLEVLALDRPLESSSRRVPSGRGFRISWCRQGSASISPMRRSWRRAARSTRKTDRRDAALLGRMLAAGLIPEVYPTPATQRETLQLLRHQAILVRQRTSFANRIHA